MLLASCRRPDSSLDLAYGPEPSQRLDVHPSPEPGPLLILLHGGGWESGSRAELQDLIPSLMQHGYTVANLDYRTTSEAKAPAAAEDVRRAIEWVSSRAGNWGADPSRMVLMGFSAGAHLALLAALAPDTAIEGPQCHPAAIVSFWGVTDVAPLLEGPDQRDFAVNWLPDTPNRAELARALSPLNYELTDAPPLCAVHSVFDDVVPFEQSKALVEKYLRAGRPAELISLRFLGHQAPPEESTAILAQVFDVLERFGAAS